MLDYDTDGWFTPVHKDVKRLQNHFQLGDCHVLRTNQGYHVYELTPRPFEEVLQIISYSDSDNKHKIAPFFKKKEKCWTLRISEKNGTKPEYHTTMYGEDYEISKGHANLLQAYFGVPIDERLEQKDTQISVVNYYQKEVKK